MPYGVCQQNFGEPFTAFFEARLGHMEVVKARAKKEAEVQVRRLTTSPEILGKEKL